jgi:hypothetical protein
MWLKRDIPLIARVKQKQHLFKLKAQALGLSY